MPPHPSLALPQSSPAGQAVAGVHEPHWLAFPPPPQVLGAVQLPQASMPPQPSGTVPQSSPAGHVVAGMQTTFTVVMASTPYASRARTIVVPTTGPAVNTPVDASMIEHLLAVSHVVSMPVYH